MQTSQAKRNGELTGRHMLVLFAAFFGVVIAVNLVLAVYANTSWSGLVVNNSYVASQEYNKVIAAERRQEALGWNGRFKHDASGLALILSGPDGQPLRELAVSARLKRPTHEGEDRTILLTETAPGIYSAEIALPAGLWEARVEVSDGEEAMWRADYRYVTTKAQ